MNGLQLRCFLLLIAVGPLAGCQDKPAANCVPADPEAEIQAMLATLAPADRRLTEQQKYCPIMPDVRLGEMGPPHKVELQGKSIFVCCKTCVKIVQEDPNKAVAQFNELRDVRTKVLSEPSLPTSAK